MTLADQLREYLATQTKGKTMIDGYGRGSTVDPRWQTARVGLDRFIGTIRQMTGLEVVIDSAAVNDEAGKVVARLAHVHQAATGPVEITLADVVLYYSARTGRWAIGSTIEATGAVLRLAMDLVNAPDGG